MFYWYSKNQYNQSGRSMIEIIAVIAIVSLLSFLGIRVFKNVSVSLTAKDILNDIGTMDHQHQANTMETPDVPHAPSGIQYNFVKNKDRSLGYKVSGEGLTKDLANQVQSYASQIYMVFPKDIVFSDESANVLCLVPVGKCSEGKFLHGGCQTLTQSDKEALNKECRTGNGGSGSGEGGEEISNNELNCNANEYPDGDHCESCGDHVVSCDDDGDITECESDYYINGNQCQSCPTNATCDGETFTCDQNYFKSGNACALISCASYTGTSMTGTGGVAGLANDGQTDCKCPSGKIWGTNSCVCPSNQYLNGSTCTTCPLNATCNDGETFTCDPGYEVDGNTCKAVVCTSTVTTSIENCQTQTTCTSPSGTFYTCTECETGFKLDSTNTNCIACVVGDLCCNNGEIIGESGKCEKKCSNNSDCGGTNSGYYCHIVNANNGSCWHFCGTGDIGYCKAIVSNTQTVPGVGQYTFSQKMTFQNAKNWCEAQDMSLIDTETFKELAGCGTWCPSYSPNGSQNLLYNWCSKNSTCAQPPNSSIGGDMTDLSKNIASTISSNLGSNTTIYAYLDSSCPANNGRTDEISIGTGLMLLNYNFCDVGDDLLFPLCVRKSVTGGCSTYPNSSATVREGQQIGSTGCYCNPGYEVEGNTCKAVVCSSTVTTSIENCQTQTTCTSPSGTFYTCTECETGYTLSENGDECVEDDGCGDNVCCQEMIKAGFEMDKAWGNRYQQALEQDLTFPKDNELTANQFGHFIGRLGNEAIVFNGNLTINKNLSYSNCDIRVLGDLTVSPNVSVSLRHITANNMTFENGSSINTVNSIYSYGDIVNSGTINHSISWAGNFKNMGSLSGSLNGLPNATVENLGQIETDYIDHNEISRIDNTGTLIASGTYGIPATTNSGTIQLTNLSVIESFEQTGGTAHFIIGDDGGAVRNFLKVKGGSLDISGNPMDISYLEISSGGNVVSTSCLNIQDFKISGSSSKFKMKCDEENDRFGLGAIHQTGGEVLLCAGVACSYDESSISGGVFKTTGPGCHLDGVETYSEIPWCDE